MTATERAFNDGHLWTLDFATALEGARLLADAPEVRHADLVLAVARGGLWPAATIAARLRLPLVSVQAMHNPSDAVRIQAGNVVNVSPFSGFADAPQQGVIVDDICGTGSTLEAVRAVLPPPLNQAPAVTLCRNTAARLSPEAWVWDVSDWVCFPWETPPSAHEPTRPLPLPEQGRIRRRR